ncbi:MAG TPA: 3-deoxy-7-phosphoheptulonate synthase [Chloroflexota bacterium]|jgi:3-deoxy-7-phosphoheptulonate synthase|nr:3-deoxy-7-phosphoheptulonate synthase [Chloroflexota bacterium]
MVIIMKLGATQHELDEVMRAVEASGFRPFLNPGVERKVVAVLGEVDIDKVQLMDQFSNMAGVERVQLISEPFKLSSKHAHPGPFEVRVGPSTDPEQTVAIGGAEVVVIAGPCSVESEEQVLTTARIVREAGARLLRGGAFKPRTSPHSFQGLGEDGLRMLAAARAETGLPVVTEVMDPHDLEVVCRYADMLQIGARNMQNFALLRWVGQTRHPVLLKRGPGARIRDFLMAAEYILAEGNSRVVLCERGIITFEDASRYTTDINAIPILKGLTHLPVILDPSHATGNWAWVKPIALAGVAAGADGLIVEVHPDPQHAKSDGKQSLKPERFQEMMDALVRLAPAVGRGLPVPIG